LSLTPTPGVLHK
nr:RecName: Full=Unknown protein 2 [Cycas revoluta]